MRNLIRGIGLSGLAGFLGGMLFFPGLSTARSGTYLAFEQYKILYSWQILVGLCMCLASFTVPFLFMGSIETIKFRCKNCGHKDSWIVCEKCGKFNFYPGFENLAASSLGIAALVCMPLVYFSCVSLAGDIVKFLERM